MDYENKYLDAGKTIIVGIDEAGYGAWAGPVAAGAVCLPLLNEELADRLRGVKDSKQMTPLQRDAAYEIIIEIALGWGVGYGQPEEIAQHGLSHAVALAYRRAYNDCVEQLKASGHTLQVVLIDGKSTWKTFVDKSIELERVPKGDTLSLTIAAASVLAKVSRDRLMIDMASEFPRYGFDRHKGYGTAAHKEALEAYGVLNGIHRINYKPIAALL